MKLEQGGGNAQTDTAYWEGGEWRGRMRDSPLEGRGFADKHRGQFPKSRRTEDRDTVQARSNKMGMFSFEVRE